MTDRDRRQGAEGSEAGLVESCSFEVCIGHIAMTNQQETSGFHKKKRGRDQKAGNPRMHTNRGKQVVRHPRVGKKKGNQ